MNAPCLRCGDFAERFPLAGLALCAACLEERDPPGPAFIILPRVRRSVVASSALVFGAVGAALGALLWLGEAWTPHVLGVTALAVLSLALWNQAALAPRRRAALLEAHGLTAVPAERIVLAHHESHRIGGLDVGALLLAEDGLAFFGQRGTRALIPFARVVTVVEQWHGLVLRLAGGVERRFILLEGQGGLGARAVAKRLAAAARARSPS